MDPIRDIGEIRSDFACGLLYDDPLPNNGDDVIGIITVDGWSVGSEEDEDTGGTVLCKVICTTHGDIVCCYTDPVYSMDERVKAVVQETVQRMRDDFKEYSAQKL